MTMLRHYALPLLAGWVVAGIFPGGIVDVSAAEFTLEAVKASAPPKLDGVADDAVWKSAPVMNVKAVKGYNFVDGATTGTVQAAYVGDTLYMLLQWQDAERSAQRSPFVKKADGKWEQLKDPKDMGGDNNVYYEDKASVIWNIGDSVFGFEKRGCQMNCHSGEPGKPYGNKYTEEEGELADIWHVKSVRTLPVGQIDDQYLDHTRFDPKKSKGAGRHGDPKTGGGYKKIGLKDGVPEFMNKDAKPANGGGTYWLKATDAVVFDDSKFKVGDEVASIMISPLEGDRGDISAGGEWKDGKWTVELSRKLVTGSPYDVQFEDLGGSYFFGVAFFDNAQVRHAFTEKPLKLVFQQ